jgi:DNA-binding GntR family transcriptional regulator
MVADLHAPSLVDALSAALRELVLSDSLPGGSPVTENEIATLYSVARPSAKAAIERLVHQGLLRRTANKTARIPLITADDARDLYFSRSFFEREVVATLARNRTVPAAARESLARMREAIRNDSLTEIVVTDIEFHCALVAAVGSQRLIRMYESVIGETHLCMAQVQAHHLLDADKILSEHEAIMAAIETGDSERAAAELTDHLGSAASRLLDYYESDSYRAVRAHGASESKKVASPSDSTA